MYEAYWGLSEKPFENTPDPRFFFASGQHQEACARMLYCIRERKGAGFLTGAFGCGKTVVGHVIFQELNQERYRSAFITNPRLSEVDFLRMVAYQLGVIHPPSNKTEVLIALQELVANNASEGRDTVVLVDEAHTIVDLGVFEELRLLLNFQVAERFLVTLLLFGQPELARVINENKPFEQRIGIKSRLEGLTLEETRDYVVHRLRVAGMAHPETVFSQEALGLVYESTGGLPRRINRLCDVCLLAGFGARAQTVDAAVVRDEVKGLAV